jgi:hypothetical protein
MYTVNTRAQHAQMQDPMVFLVSVADPGCLSQISDSKFVHPGSQIYIGFMVKKVRLQDPGGRIRNLEFKYF